MCGDVAHNHQPALNDVDEFLLDTPVVRDFIADVRAAIARSDGPASAIAAIQPAFTRLLQDEAWLPEKFATPVENSGMGGGIGQWLIFRSGTRDLALFSLVVPAGAATPVHDHLAWGLIGLYRGIQEEIVYQRQNDDVPIDEHEELQLAFKRVVTAGAFYPLIPPVEDIHQVRTISPTQSVSIHLLANDTGCVWRHTYEPETSAVRPFRSGYANRPCAETEEATPGN